MTTPAAAAPARHVYRPRVPLRTETTVTLTRAQHAALEQAWEMMMSQALQAMAARLDDDPLGVDVDEDASVFDQLVNSDAAMGFLLAATRFGGSVIAGAPRVRAVVDQLLLVVLVEIAEDLLADEVDDEEADLTTLTEALLAETDVEFADDALIAGSVPDDPWAWLDPALEPARAALRVA